MTDNIILQVGVKAFLKNPEGKYLLLKRSAIKYPESPNKWDIAGGRINPGSPLLENLKREIKEETGLDLTSTPKLISAQDILKVPGKHVVRLSYIALIEGEIILDTEEHEEYRWVTIDEMKKMDNLDQFVKEVISNRNSF